MVVKNHKADISKRVSTTLGVPLKEASEMVETVLSIMKDTISTGEMVKISGFGCFDVREKADRRGRNPQTGEALTISARRILRFRPSTILRKVINEN